MKNIKQIFTGRLRTVTCIIVVIMFVLIVVTQLAAAEDSARRDAHSRFSQIEHILAENETDRETVRESFNADNLRSARIAAYMIQNHPDILLDDERMRELAALLGVEEIWVFDDEGTIFAGTTPDFYGLTFDSGEQLAFFKPMLEDKTLELCQDIMPRTADGKLFQYSAIWNDEGTAIVQVGRSAANAAMVMERFDLSYIFSLLRVNMEVDYYAIDSETGLISGATDEHYIGKDLSEAGFDMETVAGHGDGFHAVVAGIPSYCVFTGMGPNLIGRVIPDSVLYSGLVQKCVELIVMLVAAALVLIFVVSRYVDRLVIKNIYHVNEKLGAITAGRLDERVELRNSAEFSALSDYINGMVSSLHEKVREKEEVFDIVAQHSNRILYSYDLASRTTHPLDTAGGKKDVLAHLYTGDYTDEALTENSAVMPDSVGDVRRFFYDIHSGVPSGELKIHIRLEDGRPAWYHFKYSSIFVGGKPVSALISVTDITEEHEHELAHLRFERSMGEDVEQHMGYLEADLVLDYIEKHKGRHYLNLRSFEGGSYTSYCENGFVGLAEEERAAAQEVYSKDNLIDACRRGMHRLDNVWSMAAGGDRKWVRISVELVEDPLNGHVKMFATLTDVTAEQEERMAVSRRADYDAMTGLLRRDVGEARIKEYLSDSGRKGGILITLDLDDLKGINDTLGHKQGDRAIIGIATVLKSHFRRDDILVRAGGDEFIVFLPDAAHNVESVDVSMTALLQKLSRIFVGEGSERSIHCSAGCAVDADGDSYDTLFSRADTALYHVKRSGKNNFAFYVPEMDREDYEFRAKRLLSMQGAKKFALAELQYLLDSIIKFYQLVLSVDISNNSYFIMEEVRDGVFSKVPPFGTLTGFVELSGAPVHADDKKAFFEKLSREGLLAAYERGEESVHCHFRFGVGEKYRWVECMVIFYTNENGDVCDFTLLRWADEHTNEIERLRLKKILGLSAASNFEYICLIDVEKKTYSTFSRDEENSHSIPKTADFDEVTRYIRDTHIPEEARAAYYENAALDRVLAYMRRADDSYSYRYAMTDGITREAEFSWYEDSHFELLMVVRRLG